MIRVIIIASDTNERRLIAAQLSEQTGAMVDGAATVREALTLKLPLTALVILDWSNVKMSEDERNALFIVARDVPLLVLASRADKIDVEQFHVSGVPVMYRPFTIGDVVSKARTLLK